MPDSAARQRQLAEIGVSIFVTKAPKSGTWTFKKSKEKYRVFILKASKKHKTIAISFHNNSGWVFQKERVDPGLEPACLT
jgi:hypothetical protein